MAVYERSYGAYAGERTPAWSRFLVLPRYALREIVRSRVLAALRIAWLLWVVVLVILVYLPYNASFLKLFNTQSGNLLSIFEFDAEWFFFWFMTPLVWVMFLEALWVGPTLVSPDLRNNGLPLYLARPFSRAEYVLSKFSVMAILLSALSWIPGLLLFLFRSYMAGWEWFIDHLRIGVAIFVCSWIWILILGLLSLALSAYVKFRPLAMAALVGVFFVAAPFGATMNAVFHTRWGTIFNIGEMVKIVWLKTFGIDQTIWIFGLSRDFPVIAAVASLAAVCGLCLLLLARKVRAYEVVR
jgi:ABC-2 type transport system permease protein